METSYKIKIDWSIDDLIMVEDNNKKTRVTLTDNEIEELSEHADEHISDMMRDGYECGQLGTNIYRDENEIEIEGYWEKD